MSNRDLFPRRREILAGAAATVAAAPVARAATAARRPELIRDENARPGSRDWRLTKVEPVTCASEDDLYQRRRAIEGYCSHTSLRAGETLDVFVSTATPTPFSVDIYRMGYYGGDGARLMTSLGPLRGRPQREPVDGPKKRIEANWKASVRHRIPTDWPSGVYLGKLTAKTTGYQAYVIFIVRDDRESDYLFQCSDITWQAYNRWPAWRSLYDWEDNRWHTKPGADVSFDRPYGLYWNGLPSKWNPLSNGSGEFLMWEFPLAFWMEKHGYDVSYISNLDTHGDGRGLLRARGFLSVGHDEYWTQAMLDNVSRARDSGVNLAFLSGNAVATRVYMLPSSDGRRDRVFGRDKRLDDEQELMGCSSYGVGAGPWVCQKPAHWLFAGTGMKKGDEIHDLVGWEYHGPPYRKDDRLEILAASPVHHENWKMGDHGAVMYPGPKGNFVFNAGTCWWSMVLSSPPGYQNPPNKNFTKDDARVQRMTQNLLERMRGHRPA